MRSYLIIAFGNASRRDDGVAFHIVRRLAERLGAPMAASEDLESGEIVPGVAVRGVQQLRPTLASDLARCDVAVFVDAHVAGAGWEQLHWQAVQRAERGSATTHRLTPQGLLALCAELYGKSPEAYTLSVEGTDFAFGEQLSSATAALAEQAAERLLRLVRPAEHDA